MAFDLSNYETVEDRLAKFWEANPRGRILTELVHRDEKTFIVRAEAYSDPDDPRPGATGYAHEVVGSNPVNKTSALENCETSAIGRALANLGFAPKGARPSREEMSKSAPAPAERNGGTEPTTDTPPGDDRGSGSPDLRNAVLEIGKSIGLSETKVRNEATKAFKTNFDDLDDDKLQAMYDHYSKQGASA